MPTVYIDPGYVGGGSDGSIESPWTTWEDITVTSNTIYSVQGGVTLALADRMILHPAVGSGTDITLNSYGTGKATIDASGSSNENTTITSAADNLTIENIALTAPPVGGDGYAIFANGENIKIDNVDITGHGESYDHLSHAIRLHDATWPFAITNCNISGYCVCILIYDGTPSGVGEISGNFLHPDSHANQVDDSDGVTIGASGWLATDSNYNLKIHNNKITNMGENGVDLVGATNALVYNNEIYSPAVGFASPYGVLLGTTSNAAYGNKAFNNYIHDFSVGGGIHSRGGVNSFVYNNLIVDCGNGLSNGIAGSNDNTYANNTIIDCLQSGIRVSSGTTGILAYNNIILNPGNYYISSSAGNEITYFNNCFLGASFSGTPTDGGNNITVNPELDINYFPASDSPCIGAGTTLISAYDFNTRPKVGNGDHIGAKWPLIGSAARRGL